MNSKSVKQYFEMIVFLAIWIIGVIVMSANIVLAADLSTEKLEDVTDIIFPSWIREGKMSNNEINTMDQNEKKLFSY